VPKIEFRDAIVVEGNLVPKIYVTGMVEPGELGGQPFGKGMVVVQIVPFADSWLMQCSGDQIDACPADLEPGDTWAEMLNAVLAAWKHVEAHERRSLGTRA
jgi:hypothetical protein